MSSTLIAHGLFAWTLDLENGETRTVMAPTLGMAIWGVLPSPVIRAARGDAIDPAAPAPSITALVPASAPLGAPNFTLRVQGANFRTGDAILWNGSPEPTTFVSPTELTTGVNMATAEVPIAIPVAVQALTGQASNVATFDLVEAAPPEGGDQGREGGVR